MRPDQPLSPGSDMVIEESDGDGEGSHKEKDRESEGSHQEKDVSSSTIREESPTRARVEGLGINVRRSITEQLPSRPSTGGMLNVPISVRRGDEHAP